MMKSRQASLVLMKSNECSRRFRMFSPPDGRVHRLVGQLIDASIVLMLTLFNVLLCESSFDERARTVRPDLLPLNCRKCVCVK